MRERETLGERLTFRTYATIEWAAIRMPERLGRRIFDIAGRLAFLLASRQRTVVSANLAQVLGRPPQDPLVRATTRDAYRSYVRYWYETFHLPAWSGSELQARTQIIGFEHIESALERGNGCVIALPHLGNWDQAAAWLGSLGVPVVSVAEDLRPRRLMELFLRHREALGMRIEILGGDGDIMTKLLAHLRANRVVALVADRALSSSGVEVEMFGATRKLPAGPAVLARKTGAPLLVAGAYMARGGWRIVVSSPVDTEGGVAAVTERVAAGMERVISAEPAQWHLFQPGWP